MDRRTLPRELPVSFVPPRWHPIPGRFSPDLSAAFVREILYFLAAPKTRHFVLRSIACTGVILLWAWNWILVLATGAGAGLMLAVYHLQEKDWRSLLRSWRAYLSGTRGKLAIAVGSGSLGALGTYLAATIWTHQENRWLAIGSIVQGIGTVATLLLLGGHFLAGNRRNEEETVERWLKNLTAPDPLDRLIAVRSLSDLDVSSPRRQQILEFFRYLLAREKDPDVRSALLDNFQRAEQVIPPKPLQIPLQMQSIAKRI